MKQEKSISIRFPFDLPEAIKKLAQEDKRSINSEVVWILQDYVQKRKEGKKV